MSVKDELHEAERKCFISDAELRYITTRQGDALAKKKGYKDLEGMDAIIRFLCDKHHWFPHQVRQLSTEDLNLLLKGDL
jgi:predicted nucleotidyltransferase